MNDENGLKHSWLAFSLRLGLSIIGFASTLMPFDQVNLQVDGRTFSWIRECPAYGRIIRTEHGRRTDWPGLDDLELMKAFGGLTPSRLTAGNSVTEVAAAENERDFLLHAVVKRVESEPSTPDLSGFIHRQTPKRIHIAPSGPDNRFPSKNSSPSLKTSQIKIVDQDNRESDHFIVAEDHSTETRVVDVFPVSRSIRGYHGSHYFKEVRFMEATAYYPGPECTGRYAAQGLTFTGKKAGYGVVAVDPEVIALGTRLYIEGYGFAEAEDVGGAIKGNMIDLCFETYQEAVNYGRKRIKVYILE